MAQILLGEEDYQALGTFFINSWKKRISPVGTADYKYRVYISRRCYLLNEIFYQENAAEIEQGRKQEIWKDVRKNTFLNQYGLMCKARELADCYGKEMRGFPPILIIDELAIYGREIFRLLIKMTKLIVEAYAEQFGPVSGETENKIANDFLSAVDIRIYGKNQKELLLPEALDSRLTFAEEMPARRWRSFVQNVSALTAQTDGVRNKSFYPLFSVRKERLKEEFDSGQSRSYGYHGKRLRVYQTKKNGILFAFCERDGDAKKEYLPIPLWGDIPKERAEILLRDTAAYFESLAVDTAMQEGRTDFHHVISLLRDTAPGLLQVQFQMISFIMAVISFCHFAQDRWELTVDDSACSMDIERCAMNFGLIEELEPELREIVALGRSSDRYEKLEEIIHKAFSENTGLSNPLATEKTNDTVVLLRATESYFSRISNADGRALAAMRENGLVFDALTKDHDMIPLQDYLNAGDIPGNLEDRVFSMLLLLEDGQISINAQLCDGKMQLRLKTGESVKFIAAERIRRFIPALSALEEWSGYSGFSPKQKIWEFGKFIGDAEPALYEGIDEQFSAFAQAQYDCGDKVSDWDIGFIRGVNTPDFRHKEWYVDPWSGRPWSKEEEKDFEACNQSYWQREWIKQNEVSEMLGQYVRKYSC